MSDTHTPSMGTRRGDGGTYLIVADDTAEFSVALDYACCLAQTRRGHVAVAHITELDDFVHWGKVEAMMRHDLRAKAEQEVWEIAKRINDTYAITPSLYIREGKRIDNIIHIINEEKRIRSLILAGSTAGSGPGPLITHFSSKGIAQLRVPMVIVPGHFDREAIESVVNPLRLGLD